MASSWMLRRVAHVGTDISEELGASIIRVTRIGELGTSLAVATDAHCTEDWGDMLLRNTGSYKNHMASSYPRRRHSSLSP
jgi:hypothetical protein